PVLVDLPVSAQHTRHDAVRARFLGPPDVLEHHRELSRRVEEVTAAWPNEDEDGDLEPRPADRERTRGGRCAALYEVGAELDPVRAASGGGECGFNRIDARFDEDGSAHVAKIIGRLSPKGSRPFPRPAAPRQVA